MMPLSQMEIQKRLEMLEEQVKFILKTLDKIEKELEDVGKLKQAIVNLQVMTGSYS